MANTDVGVYIGRFNPFHLGHAYVLEQALKKYKLVIVLVGSAFQPRMPKNPFTYAERKDMIETWKTDWSLQTDTIGNLVVLPMRDFASNNMWIKSVQATVHNAMNKFCLARNEILTDVTITGSDRDDTTWYLEAFPHWNKDLVPALQHKPGTDADLSATSVRRVLYESDILITTNGVQFSDADLAVLQQKLPKTTVGFITSFIRKQPEELGALRVQNAFIKEGKEKWAGSPHPVTFNTADAVIIQSGHVLMIQRANQPGYGLWALPGGYVNQHERIRAAAVREALEETGIRLTTGKNAEEITKKMLDGAIRGKEIFDDPNRSERGRIITVAYLMRLDDTKPLPKVSGQLVPAYESNGKETVETFAAEWKRLEWVSSNTHLIFEDHDRIIGWAEAQIDQ
jgi:bifunctional NMN adenylyltransferase/nudix hydrolase